jgi:hypothetical protein
MNGAAARDPVPRQSREAAMQLLKDCLRDRDPLDIDRVQRQISSTTPATILALATYHRVGGMVYERLRQLVRPEDPLVTSLAVGYEAAVRGHMRVLWELARLKPVLDGTAVRWAVIKGPALVEPLYGAPGRRPYADLDLLVEPSGFREILGALEGVGSPVLDRNWSVLNREMRGEVHLFLPGGTPLDLHWNVVNMYRRGIWIETTELLDRAVEIDLGGIRTKTLDDADTILHLALHASVSGGDRLIWLKDIERASTRAFRWETVVERARQWKIAGSVGLILARSRDVLGAEVPDWVPRRLLRYGSPTLIRIVDRISPWEFSMGRLSAANLLLSRGISYGLFDGSKWILERSIRNLDPREPAASSAFTPTGGDSDKDAFLDAVVASGANRRLIERR